MVELLEKTIFYFKRKEIHVLQIDLSATFTTEDWMLTIAHSNMKDCHRNVLSSAMEPKGEIEPSTV